MRDKNCPECLKIIKKFGKENVEECGYCGLSGVVELDENWFSDLLHKTIVPGYNSVLTKEQLLSALQNECIKLERELYGTSIRDLAYEGTTRKRLKDKDEVFKKQLKLLKE